MTSVHRYTLFQNRTQVPDFPALVASFDPKEFGSPTRSTIPLLMLLRDAPALFDRLLSVLGVPVESQPGLHLEYLVEGPRGRGRPSHTDLMVRTASLQLALEIKWGEPRYEDVEAWLGKGDSRPSNKAERLAGWLELLQPQANHALRIEDFGPAVYQMVHRAASACEDPRLRPRLAYVLFLPHPEAATSDHAPYLEDLKTLKALLGGAPAFPFDLVEVRLRPTSAFEVLRPLRKGTAETIDAVRRAVLAGDLFEFHGFTHHAIGVS